MLCPGLETDRLNLFFNISATCLSPDIFVLSERGTSIFFSCGRWTGGAGWSVDVGARDDCARVNSGRMSGGVLA